MRTTASIFLPLTRLHLTVRADALLQLPPYAGSMLRGAFGHALMALSPLPHVGDQPCALHATCPYCQIFAAPPLPAHSLQKFSHMPQPYVIEPPIQSNKRVAAKQIFEFDLVLIGKALGMQAVVEQAWQRALRLGLGSEKTPCTLLNISASNTKKTPLNLPEQLIKTQHIKLHFYTPLRLQVKGKPVQAAQLAARDVLIALARRYQLLCDVHLGAAAPQLDFPTLMTQADQISADASALRWFDWGRYSQRQQQEMRLGGLQGSLQLRGDLAPFAQLLHIGQWLHVGKNASMGLGGYQLEVLG